MVNRRYFLVVIGSSDRAVRRFSVSRRALSGLGIALCSFLLIGVVLTVHGLGYRQRAFETSSIARQNDALRLLTNQLELQLAHYDSIRPNTTFSFAELWNKSGLGSSPRMLAMGPLESLSPSSFAEELDEFTPPESEILQVEIEKLPNELARLARGSLETQTSVAELLEYFHDATLLLSNTPSIRPVQTSFFITSKFGKRKDPIHHSWVMHKGLDLGGPIGSPVQAPADGVVIFSGVRGGYGLTVVIDHGYGLQTHYAHLNRSHVTPGTRVKRGYYIADLGNSGRSTGPHLHYEVRRLGHPLNPARFILD